MSQEYKVAYPIITATVTAKAYRGDPPDLKDTVILSDSVYDGIFEGDAGISLVAGDWIVYYDGTTIIAAETYKPKMLIGGSGAIRSAGYLGDYLVSETLYFIWYGDITGGTVKVYKDSGDVPDTSGVTETKPFDSKTGVNLCVITFSQSSFYTRAADYHIMLVDAVIDGETTTVDIGSFSIENRYAGKAFIRQG